MAEIGETVGRVDTLIKETKLFQKLCRTDIDRAEEVNISGVGRCINSLLVVDLFY